MSVQFQSLSFALAPSSPAPSADTVLITSDYTLAAGDDLQLTGLGLKVQVRHQAVIHVQLDGDVTVDNGGDATGLVTTASVNGAALISNTGAFTVTSTASGAAATGFELNGADDMLDIGGATTVTSAQGTAVGVAASGDNVEITNHDMLRVEAAGQGVGVGFSGGGSVLNDGAIQVSSHALAAGFLAYGGGGVDFQNDGLVFARAMRTAGEAGPVPTALGVGMYGGTFDNGGYIVASAQGIAAGVELVGIGLAFNDPGGVITVHASGPNAEEIGVLFGSLGANGSPGIFVNQGVIRAEIAFSSSLIDPDGALQELPGADGLFNAGKVIGDVVLGVGDDAVVNGRSIRGDIFLGDGADLYDSHTGRTFGEVWGGLGDDSLRGSKDGDVLHGDDAGGVSGGADTLQGLRGDDSIDGGAGADQINGGLGADHLTGGDGADLFIYARVGDSVAGSADLITDLGNDDIIALWRIDADTTAGGDQAFHLVSSFSGAAGELVLSYDAGADLTTISGDVDGDGTADLVITAAGDHHDFTGFAL